MQQMQPGGNTTLNYLIVYKYNMDQSTCMTLYSSYINITYVLLQDTLCFPVVDKK